MSSNYDDLRRHIENAEKRAHRRTLLATLIPITAVIALVLVAGSRLITANKELNQANADLKKANAELKQEISDRDAISATLTKRITTLEEEKREIEGTLKLLQQRPRYTPQLEMRINEAIRTAEAPSTPLVDLHIADESQRKIVRDLQTDLIKSNYVSPGIENVGRGGARIPKTTEVRYFRDEDRDAAQRLVAQLVQKGISATAVRTGGNGDKPKFEIWFAHNAFKHIYLQ